VVVKNMENVTRAVKIEENAKVSPDKFKIPQGYTLK